MNLRGTNPALVRLALATAARHGVRPAARMLGVHVTTLQRWRRAAAALGPDWPTLDMDRAYLDGLEDRRARAQKMAAYRKDILLGRHSPGFVDSTGTIRRIHALQRLGWKTEIIAAHGPWSSNDAVAELTKRSRISRRNAEIIAEIYDLLSMTVGPSEGAMRWAESRGWPPPLAWDDDTIDDPGAEPHCGQKRRRGRSSGSSRPALDHSVVDQLAVERILAGDWRAPAGKATRTEVVRRWDEMGRPRRELRGLTGWMPERYGLRREAVAS